MTECGDHVRYGCVDCDWMAEGALERPGLHDGDVLRAVERHERETGHSVNQLVSP